MQNSKAQQATTPATMPIIASLLSLLKIIPTFAVVFAVLCVRRRSTSFWKTGSRSDRFPGLVEAGALSAASLPDTVAVAAFSRSKKTFGHTLSTICPSLLKWNHSSVWHVFKRVRLKGVG
jgi:hypothetical protein